MSAAEKQATREEMARIEIGRTEIVPFQAWLLAILFILPLIVIAPRQASLEFSEQKGEEAYRPQALEILQHLRQAPSVYRGQEGSFLAKVFAANRFMLEKINTYETGLEKGSFLEKTLLPPMQLAFTSWIGLGNEEAYIGSGQWLFYRPGVDSVMGPAFLDSKQMLYRSRSGNEWQKPPQPDPLLAVEQFRDQLAARDIQLVLMPVPVKPSIHPEGLSGYYEGGGTPLQNPSFDSFLTRLDELEIPYVEPSERFVALGSNAFLYTDTHWKPQAMEVCATALAERLLALDGSLQGQEGYTLEGSQVTAPGDIAAMLKLPADQSVYDHETVEIRQVRREDGSLWKRDRNAAVLVLGDSFSNIYSAEEMGWGQAAGLVEHLSHALDAPIDAILQNDAGAYATRATLVKEMGLGHDRLAGKKVVVWEFAARELAVGDWKLLDMKLEQVKKPVEAEQMSGFLVLNEKESVKVQGLVAEVSLVPIPGTVPYKDHVRTLHVRELAPMEGGQALVGDEAHVYVRSMQDNIWTVGGRVEVGERVTLHLSSWYDMEESYGRLNRSTIDALDFEEPCWGEVQ